MSADLGLAGCSVCGDVFALVEMFVVARGDVAAVLCATDLIRAIQAAGDTASVSRP